MGTIYKKVVILSLAVLSGCASIVHTSGDESLKISLVSIANRTLIVAPDGTILIRCQDVPEVLNAAGDLAGNAASAAGGLR